jgi:hypothetical protein
MIGRTAAIVLVICMLGLVTVYQEVQRIRMGYAVVDRAQSLAESRETVKAVRMRVEALKDPARLVELNQLFDLGLKPNANPIVVQVPLQ